MDDNTRRALSITRDSPSRDRTIDITTIGARSGRPRRIETWFYLAQGRLYLSGLPGRRDWAANLVANPEFTFHLKNRAPADLPATARLITDEAERRAILTELVGDRDRPNGASGDEATTELERWLTGSPLFEVSIDGYGAR